MINKHGKSCVIWDISTFWSHLPCFLWKGPLKRDFVDIYLTTFFGIINFGNTSAMRVIFFWNCWKLYLNFKNAEHNWEKAFLFLHNCIWIGRVNLSLLRRENLWPATKCSQKVRGFCILLRGTSSNSIAFPLINKYAKGAVVQISTVFGPIYHVAFPKVFWKRIF